MKAFGDIPPDHVALVEELEKLESWFYSSKDKVSSLDIAKGFTCIAHDYYCLDMEEEGERLLRAAESICPGYFKGPIISQMANDDLFYLLVEQFRDTLGMSLMHALGFGK